MKEKEEEKWKRRGGERRGKTKEKGEGQIERRCKRVQKKEADFTASCSFFILLHSVLLLPIYKLIYRLIQSILQIPGSKECQSSRMIFTMSLLYLYFSGTSLAFTAIKGIALS